MRVQNFCYLIFFGQFTFSVYNYFRYGHTKDKKLENGTDIKELVMNH